MTLRDDFDRVTWYGLGPGESYVDSKESALVGRYEKTVDELHTPYVRPQENGNRTDVRWVTFADAQGLGVHLSGDSSFDVSAHRYAIEELDDAEHVHDLPRRGEIAVSLNHTHCGLGSGSCGPPTLERYRVLPEAFEFRIELRPVSR